MAKRYIEILEKKENKNADCTYTKFWRELLRSNSYFVKSPVKELEAVNEADGDPDAGIEIKANELKRRVAVDKIPYEMDNTN